MPGIYCLAKFSGDGLFYRAKITNVRAEAFIAEVREREREGGGRETVGLGKGIYICDYRVIAGCGLGRGLKLLLGVV